jgi:hypothetical protein
MGFRGDMRLGDVLGWACLLAGLSSGVSFCRAGELRPRGAGIQAGLSLAKPGL